MRANITGVSARIESTTITVLENGQYAAEEFQHLALTCAASGIPPPTIVWLFDGTVLSSGGRRTITGTSTHSNLTIDELQLSNGGTYRCRATSGNVSPIPGQTAITFELNVAPHDECSSSPCQNGGVCVDGIGNYTCNCGEDAVSLIVYSGRNCQNEEDTGRAPVFTTQPVGRRDKLYDLVTLNCNAEGNPVPIIMWFKDNQPLKGPQAVGPTYTIDRIAPEDRGDYHCRASNVRGMVDSRQVQVLIEGIVQFRVEIIPRTERRKRQAIANQTDLDALEILAIGQQLEGTGNVSAEIVSLVRIDNSNAFIVTVNTNSTESPERLTQIVTKPLTEQFEEFSDIIQAISFNVQRTERHDGCPAETSSDCSNVGNIEWPETEIGVEVPIRCPCGPESENPLPDTVRATRTCGGNYVDGARWNAPLCDMCMFTDNRLTLCRLLQVESVEQVANVLVNATGMTDEIMSGDVAIMSSLLDRVSGQIGSNTSDSQDTGGTQIVGDFFSSIDNIAEVDLRELRTSNTETGALNRITSAFDRVVDSIQLPENNTNGTETVILAFRNFAVQVVQPPEDNTTSFSPDMTSLLETANNMSASGARGAEFTATPLTLPPGLGSSGGRLALALFLSASLYPPSDESMVGSIIMSVSFPNRIVENLTDPVTFTFPKSEAVRNTSDNQNLTCTFWDTDANGGNGDWSTRGCMLVNETEDNVTCQCDHLTSFSMLLDVLPGGGNTTPFPPELLEGLTYIGSILSVICLVITVITYLADKKLREHLHRQLLISLSLALLGLYVTFIVSIAVSSYPEILPTIPGVCGTLSALLHYFFLVTFLCMGAIAINLYRKLVVVFNADIPNYLSIAASISWVVPMFIVGFSIAPNYKYYTADPSIDGIVPFCRAQSWPFYFGLILPFGVIYIFNMVMFTIIIVSLIRRPNVQKEGGKGGTLKRLKENFWVSVGLFVLFGASWVFGMLATAGFPDYIRLPFDIVFTVLASTQGVWVFILYCLKSPECRKLWKDWLHCRFTQSARTSVSTSNPSRSKSSKGTRSSRLNSIPRPSLVATLNRNIFNNFGKRKEDNMTSADYSSSVMSPPPFYQPPIELVHRDDPEGLSEKDTAFPFNGTGNDYFEKINFQDTFSEHSFYFGISDTAKLDKDCTVVVNEEAMLEEHSEQERYTTVKFKGDEEHGV